jgi:hypothetical protein
MELSNTGQVSNAASAFSGSGSVPSIFVDPEEQRRRDLANRTAAREHLGRFRGKGDDVLSAFERERRLEAEALRRAGVYLMRQ